MNDDVTVSDADNIQSEQIQETARPEEPVASAGAQLAALREARGWTIEQVASQLNLASRQIQALELDNYAALPGMVIVRGFIRAYAKLLREDPASILAAIVGESAAPNVLPAERNSLSASFSESKMSGKRGAPSRLAMAVLALVVIAVAAFAAQRMGWMGKKSAALASKIEETRLPLETHTENQPPLEASAPEIVPANEPAVNASSAAATEKKSPPAVAESASVESGSNSVAAPIVSADSKDALVFHVKEDSWVEIQRADGSILVSRLFKAGTTEVFEITGPASMVIGNAAGVNVALRGKPLDISGNSSNVARLNLK